MRMHTMHTMNPMKKNPRWTAAGALAAATAALVSFASAPSAARQHGDHAGHAGHAGHEAPARAQSAQGVQKVTVRVENAGYTPSSVAVKAGKPVELTFILGKNPGCGQVVQLPALGVKRTLKAGETSVVKFTPKKAGSLAFTCGMNMYKGQVVVK